MNAMIVECKRRCLQAIALDTFSLEVLVVNWRLRYSGWKGICFVDTVTLPKDFAVRYVHDLRDGFG